MHPPIENSVRLRQICVNPRTVFGWEVGWDADLHERRERARKLRPDKRVRSEGEGILTWNMGTREKLPEISR